MPGIVELAYKQGNTMEKPKDLIIRYFSEKAAGNKGDYEIFPEGIILPEVARFEKKIFGVYQKTFYFSDKQLMIILPNGGMHVLNYWEVDREFFSLFKIPDPNPLWELLDSLRLGSLKGVKFTGPPQIRQFVKKLTLETREEFQLKPDPLRWQAAISCKCDCDVFRIQTLGKINAQGLLCDTRKDLQRVELSCQNCERSIILFDPVFHGYNAVIGEINLAKVSPRVVKQPYVCSCGNDAYRIAVSVIYDADPETLLSLTTKQRNNSYGWFNALLKCTACNRLVNFVDYECA